MTYRVLITGSRTWDDWETIRTALREVYYARVGDDPNIVMINGDCPLGADAIAKKIWTAQGLEIELYPADWHKYGKRAGFVRNKQMVDLNPDVCLAFIKAGSKGASMTAKLAEDAGIPTVRFERE